MCAHGSGESTYVLQPLPPVLGQAPGGAHRALRPAGGGKSTELRRLVQRLQANHPLLPVLIDGEAVIDLSNRTSYFELLRARVSPTRAVTMS